MRTIEITMLFGQAVTSPCIYIMKFTMKDSEIINYEEKSKKENTFTQSQWKSLPSDQCKEIEEKNRMGKTGLGSSSRKLEIPRERLMQTWAQ